MATLSSAGLTIRTESEIRAEIDAAQRAEISAGLDLSDSQPEGQRNAIAARQIRLVEEALLAVYAAQDVATATGDALDRLCALSGVTRLGATYSRVDVVCTLAIGTYAAGALVAYVGGRPADRFASIESVTVTTAGDYTVAFQAERAGPVAAPSGTLVRIPVAGWSAIVSQPTATIGVDVESDSALRRRRAATVAAAGSGTAAGIVADVRAAVPLVETCTVYANPTSAEVDGVPAYGVELVVYGPAAPTSADDLAVATALYGTVGAGTPLGGSTSVVVTDAEGYPHAVNFTRVSDVSGTVTITVIRAASGYAGDGAVSEAIASMGLAPGEDLSWSRVVAAAIAVPGVLRVTAVTVNGTAFGTLAITPRQRAVVTSGAVTVTSSIGVA